MGLGKTEVEADAFGMTDVQIAVGFGWKSSMDPALMFPGLVVLGHNLLNEIQRWLGGVVVGVRMFGVHGDRGVWVAVEFIRVDSHWLRVRVSFWIVV